jgi:mono/diheme cytochrome c family protein
MIHLTAAALALLPVLQDPPAPAPSAGADAAPASGTSDATGADGTLDGHRLFVVNCATCHGETGDGQGTTKLDRPARSFQEGGFSYGNTPDALLRTITYGIPGTPMPSFESSLSAAEREALVAHVLALGPPIEVVDPERTVVRVGDVPVVVRGYLPPITDGAVERPRGLLIGRPEGVTFEYRVDDVRLLGLRQGGFVERRDWTGRGGAALRPLGGVVQLVEGGDPLPTFSLAGWYSPGPVARLEGTWIERGEAGISYRLEMDHGGVLARVREAPRPAGTSIGAGYAQSFRIVGAGEAKLALRLFAYGAGERVDSFATNARRGEAPVATEWTVWRMPDGMFAVVGVEQVPDGRTYRMTGAYEVVLRVPVGDEARVDATVLTAYAWDADVRARLAREVTR